MRVSKTKNNFPLRDLGARKAIIQLHQATNIAITGTHQLKKKNYRPIAKYCIYINNFFFAGGVDKEVKFKSTLIYSSTTPLKIWNRRRRRRNGMESHMAIMPNEKGLHELILVYKSFHLPKCLNNNFKTGKNCKLCDRLNI